MEAPEIQLKLPGLDRGRQSVAVRVTEARLQRKCVTWALLNGFETIELGKPQYDGTRPGNTPGSPDLFVIDRQRPEAGWIGFELKASERAPVRPEQQRLIDAGLVKLVWSFEQFRTLLLARRDELGL
jgi:hypothetical protein